MVMLVVIVATDFKGDNCEIAKVDPCDADNHIAQNDGICSGPLDGDTLVVIAQLL